MYQLTDSSMRDALLELSQLDPLLHRLYERVGVPPLWARPQDFATLVHIVLEQKVSLISANAVMRRVRVLCPDMQPLGFLDVTEHALQTAGVSRAKISYCRSIAAALVDGSVSLADLRAMNDQQVIDKLTSVKGVGPWSAGVYLMMALRRPDAWASGDRALVVSYCENAGTSDIMSYTEFDQLAIQWTPHRATAARLLWHAYLEKRSKPGLDYS